MRFEVVKRSDGGYGWQTRDESGNVVARPKPGGVHLPPDPEARERSRLAVQEALRQLYEAQHAVQG